MRLRELPAAWMPSVLLNNMCYIILEDYLLPRVTEGGIL
jgi:hypothetical protein